MSTVSLLVTIPYAVFTHSNDCVLLFPCVFTSTIKILLRSNSNCLPSIEEKYLLEGKKMYAMFPVSLSQKTKTPD